MSGVLHGSAIMTWTDAETGKNTYIGKFKKGKKYDTTKKATWENDIFLFTGKFWDDLEKKEGKEMNKATKKVREGTWTKGKYKGVSKKMPRRPRRKSKRNKRRGMG